MALQFSTNNRYQGLGAMPAPTLCQAWYDIKEFLKSAGWTVSQSGYSNSLYGDNFDTSDLIIDPGYASGGMASEYVWFVLRDKAGKRELMFCRHKPVDTSSDTDIGSKLSYRSAGQMAIAYSAESKFSTTIGHGFADIVSPVVLPAVASSSGLITGTGSVSKNIPGSILINVYITGSWTGSIIVEGSPDNISWTTLQNITANGNYNITNTTYNYVRATGNTVSGVGATVTLAAGLGNVAITNFNSGTNEITINIPGIPTQAIDTKIRITGSGNYLSNGQLVTTPSKNNGYFKITSVSANSITAFNPGGSIDLNGFIQAEIKYPLLIAANNPPIADDIIWFHRFDTDDLNPYVRALNPSTNADNVNWSGAVDSGDAISDYDLWNVHMCAEVDIAPYPFYIWFTNKRETLGFFAMDALQEANTSDSDQVCFWFCPITGGIGGYPATADVLSGAQGGFPTANQWSPHYINAYLPIAKNRLVAWINKPTHFTDRNDFVSKISQNKCRFLEITVPVMTMSITIDSGSVPTDEHFFTFVPRGNSTSLYASQDQLFPVMYFKYMSLQSYPEQNSGANNFPLLSLPNMYKGRSVLFKMDSVIRNQFDTLTVSTDSRTINNWSPITGTITPTTYNPSSRDNIITGSSAAFVIPWNAVPINKP